MMDSHHLISEDLDNSLLTGWPIQRTFYFSTEEKHCQPKQVCWIFKVSLDFFVNLFLKAKYLKDSS